MEATANVGVSKIDVKSLAIAVEPLPIGVGRGSRLHIDAVAADGKHYSLLESSQLKTEVGPSYLASVHGSMPARRPGRPRPAFGDLRRRPHRHEAACGRVHPGRRSPRSPSRQARSPRATGPPGGRNRRSEHRFPQHYAGPHQQLEAGGRRGHLAQPAHRPRRGRRRGRGGPRQPQPHRRGRRRQGRVPIDRHRSGQRGGGGGRCRLSPRCRSRQGRPDGSRGGACPRPAGLRQGAFAPLCRFQRPADGVAGDHAYRQEFAAGAGDALRGPGGQGPGRGGGGRRYGSN